jgi:SulP family sulfate permease
MGLARLGMLVNFVSHSVIVGFATGAGVLIAVRQIPTLLGLDVESHTLVGTAFESVAELTDTGIPTALIGIGTIILIVTLKAINRKIPASLIALVVASLTVFILTPERLGIEVIGELPKGLPPVAGLFQYISLDLIVDLASGALAIAAIGLVETIAISRTIATESGQRLDSNQEFVGQGLANIVSGVFSGYACAGSFTRSAVNYDSNARTPFAAVISGFLIIVGMFALAPLAVFMPRSALAGVLIVVAISMINRKEIARIWRGTRGDAVIMVVTFLATLFSELALAILLGIILSFALYIIRTSVPRVHQVVPDEGFNHFKFQPDQPVCPQLGVVDILGDLYFGAVNHVEEAIRSSNDKYPDQRFLLVRMHNVNQCDYSGLHMLENVLKSYREKGGDMYMVHVSYRVDKLMTSTGFCDTIGLENYLPDDEAVSYLFYKVLDPAVCIYECPHRVFAECQNLPKQLYSEDGPFTEVDYTTQPVGEVKAKTLWKEMHDGDKRPVVIDVREPREYHHGHIPDAKLVPLITILIGDYEPEFKDEQRLVLVCRSGRRSRRAALKLMDEKDNVEILQGGMLAWEAAGLLEAIE